MPRLTCTELAMHFGQRWLFRDLSFVVEPGEAVAVTGANGAGKSTLLRILAGVLTPVRGEVVLYAGGETVEDAQRPFCTGMVAPYLGLYTGFTARENLAFVARARGLGTEGVGPALARVGLAGREDDLVRTFSSGMKQRVRYAMATLAEPAVLLLDEPTSNLDAAGLAMVEAAWAAQRAAGRCLVVATNAPSEAERCDRTVDLARYA